MKTNSLLIRTLCSFMLGAAMTTFSLDADAQVKVGDNPTTINGGSVLELESTNKGLLMPRVSLTNTTTWGLSGTATAGMHVYNTNSSMTSTNGVYPVLDSKVGEYYWDGTGWVAIGQTQSADAVIRVEFSGSQNVALGSVHTVTYNTSKFDKGNNFNIAAGTFTAPTSGFYFVSFNLACNTNVTVGTGRAAYILVNNVVDRLLLNDFVPANTGYARTVPSLVKLNAGDVVKIGIASNLADWPYTTAILDINKISN